MLRKFLIRGLVVVAFPLFACGPDGPAGEPVPGQDAGRESVPEARPESGKGELGPAESPGDGEASPWEFMKGEGFGPLRLGLRDAEVLALLGPPEERGESELWGADGLYHQEWRYPRRGITVEVVSSAMGGASKVASLTVSAPSRLRTRRGIGVGDREGEVRRVYRDVVDKEMPDEKDRFIAGSVYGGLVFLFEDGRVSEMFLGASAE